MAWTETRSDSFRARHGERDARDAERVLEQLEALRDRLRALLRNAWVSEGAGQFFGGQTPYAQPAIARRLREGGRPAFPPSLRDATLLGGTVIDLLARDEGIEAAARFAVRLHPQGPEVGLREAFGRPRGEIDSAWRSHLVRLAGERRRDAVRIDM